MKIPPYFFIFDVESLGLHGDGFAVAGGVWKGHEQCVMEFAYHTSQDRALVGIAGDAKWVKENVTISPQSTLCGGTAIMNSLFWNEWKRAKEQYPGIVMAAECLWPVEARLLQKAVDEDRITGIGKALTRSTKSPPLCWRPAWTRWRPTSAGRTNCPPMSRWRMPAFRRVCSSKRWRY